MGGRCRQMIEDLDGVVDQLTRLGGTVYVPPMDSNVGRLAVVADPQTATLALINGLKYGNPAAGWARRPRRVGMMNYTPMTQEARPAVRFLWQSVDGLASRVRADWLTPT